MKSEAAKRGSCQRTKIKKKRKEKTLLKGTQLLEWKVYVPFTGAVGLEKAQGAGLEHDPCRGNAPLEDSPLRTGNGVKLRVARSRSGDPEQFSLDPSRIPPFPIAFPPCRRIRKKAEGRGIPSTRVDPRPCRAVEHPTANVCYRNSPFMIAG